MDTAALIKLLEEEIEYALERKGEIDAEIRARESASIPRPVSNVGVERFRRMPE